MRVSRRSCAGSRRGREGDGKIRRRPGQCRIFRGSDAGDSAGMQWSSLEFVAPGWEESPSADLTSADGKAVIKARSRRQAQRRVYRRCWRRRSESGAAAYYQCPWALGRALVARNQAVSHGEKARPSRREDKVGLTSGGDVSVGMHLSSAAGLRISIRRVVVRRSRCRGRGWRTTWSVAGAFPRWPVVVARAWRTIRAIAARDGGYHVTGDRRYGGAGPPVIQDRRRVYQPEAVARPLA